MKINKLMAVVCSIIIICGCVKYEIKNLDARGKTIVCFGDSITFGYGVAGGGNYPAELAKLVKLPVINAGVDGDTSLLALERLDDDVLARNPRLVIVEFCANDFIKKITREDTLHNLSKIIDRIQAKGAMVALVDISSGMFFQEYRQAFRKLAFKKGAIFIPVVLSKIITNPAMKSDFFHPNARGYKIIASRVYNVIDRYIR